GRVRVIAGAPPIGFALPADGAGRLRDLTLPHDYLAMAGSLAPSEGLDTGLHAAAAALAADPELHVVVIDAREGTEPAVADLASAAGIPEPRVHVRGALDRHDRAAVIGQARAFVAPAPPSAYPWPGLEATARGVPAAA